METKMLKIVNKDENMTDYIKIIRRIPYFILYDCIKKDVDTLCGVTGKLTNMYWNYEYEDIVQKIKNNRLDKSYCKRYINSFFDSILNELSISAYVFQNDWQKIRAYKSLQYDRRRSFNLLLGSAYTIHQNCNEGVDILQKQEYTRYTNANILSNAAEQGCLLCFEFDNNQYSNIVIDFYSDDFYITIDEKDVPVYRLGVSGVMGREIILFAEYDICMTDPLTILSTSKSGCSYCRRNCPGRNNVKYAYNYKHCLDYMKYQKEICCVIPNQKDGLCQLSKWNALNLLGMICYAYGTMNQTYNIEQMPHVKIYEDTLEFL